MMKPATAPIDFAGMSALGSTFCLYPKNSANAIIPPVIKKKIIGLFRLNRELDGLYFDGSVTSSSIFIKDLIFLVLQGFSLCSL